MTLVYSPRYPMPSDVFRPGLDILAPSLAMNPPHSTDSQWNQQPSFVYTPYDDKAQTHSTFPQPQNVLTSDIPQYQRSAYPARNRPPPIELTSLSPDLTSINRPKSSPSTFGTGVEDLMFSDHSFRSKIQTFPTTGFTPPPHHNQMLANRMTSPFFTTPEYTTPNPSRSPNQAPIMAVTPDQAGLGASKSLKRASDDDELSEYGSRKRRRAPSQSGPLELSEEEELLLQLKEEENLPWKDIAVRFRTDMGKTYQVPALQMRFKRLKERMRTWTEDDVQALEQAHDYWEKFRYDIIAAKMLDFGASERWPAKYCARKWEELHPGRTTFSLQPPPQYLGEPWDNITSPVGSIGRFSPHLGAPV